jgi:phage recombination protein Bet
LENRRLVRRFSFSFHVKNYSLPMQDIQEYKPQNTGFIITPEMLKNLEQGGIIPINTPAPQAEIFAQVCKEKGLSPFSKEIYLVCYKGVYARIIGIDGCRKIAARTKAHAGTDDVKFDIQPDGAFFTHAQIKAANRHPVSATVTVYRIVGGLKCPFTHTAVFQEYNGNVQKWLTMPLNQISKCAEMGALKKAFSDELSGLNVEEEQYAFENTQNAIAPQVEKEPAKQSLTASIVEQIICYGIANKDEDPASIVEHYAKTIEMTDAQKAGFIANFKKRLFDEKIEWELVQAMEDKTETLDSLSKDFYFTAQQRKQYAAYKGVKNG